MAIPRRAWRSRVANLTVPAFTYGILDKVPCPMLPDASTIYALMMRGASQFTPRTGCNELVPFINECSGDIPDLVQAGDPRLRGNLAWWSYNDFRVDKSHFWSLPWPYLPRYDPNTPGGADINLGNGSERWLCLGVYPVWGPVDAINGVLDLDAFTQKDVDAGYTGPH